VLNFGDDFVAGNVRVMKALYYWLVKVTDLI